MPTKTIRVPRKKGERGWYTEKQKLDAFALYLTLGNMYEVSRRLDIEIKTLYSWKYSPWWKEQYRELEAGNKIKLGTKVSGILSKASSELEDRLDNGNLIYNPKTKELERRPLQVKELVDIVRAGVQTQESVDRALEALTDRDQRDARALEAERKLKEIHRMLSEGPKPTKQVVEYIDVTPIEVKNDNAIQSGVQAGLQTGE